MPIESVTRNAGLCVLHVGPPDHADLEELWVTPSDPELQMTLSKVIHHLLYTDCHAKIVPPSSVRVSLASLRDILRLSTLRYLFMLCPRTWHRSSVEQFQKARLLQADD